MVGTRQVVSPARIAACNWAIVVSTNGSGWVCCVAVCELAAPALSRFGFGAGVSDSLLQAASTAMTAVQATLGKLDRTEFIDSIGLLNGNT